jgi:hypothetical protein
VIPFHGARFGIEILFVPAGRLVDGTMGGGGGETNL